jgi:hypothetical protein
MTTLDQSIARNALARELYETDQAALPETQRCWWEHRSMAIKLAYWERAKAQLAETGQ